MTRGRRGAAGVGSSRLLPFSTTTLREQPLQGGVLEPGAAAKTPKWAALLKGQLCSPPQQKSRGETGSWGVLCHPPPQAAQREAVAHGFCGQSSPVRTEGSTPLGSDEARPQGQEDTGS